MISLLAECARKSTSYRTIREAITTKQKLATMPRDHPALLLQALWEIIQELHRSHCGLEKTLAMARGLYFWPGMRGQLKQMIEKCELSQKFQPS